MPVPLTIFTATRVEAIMNPANPVSRMEPDASESSGCDRDAAFSLVMDARAGLSPAEMVERKLAALSRHQVLPPQATHARRAGSYRAPLRIEG